MAHEHIKKMPSQASYRLSPNSLIFIVIGRKPKPSAFFIPALPACAVELYSLFHNKQGLREALRIF
jgi:hypothetical protein